MSIGQKQKASSLRFRLYNRPLHPELFDIYHDHRIVQKDYDAQVWVTGCTHLIGFYHQGRSLVELTAAADSELPQRGLLLDSPFRGERDHECNGQDGIKYMVNFQLELMSPMAYARTHHELARLGARRGLFVPFPAWTSRSPVVPAGIGCGGGPLTPFTYIDYEARADQLHVFAFHAFPEERTIVKTQSIFELV
jgi:hypothetical protein